MKRKRWRGRVREKEMEARVMGDRDELKERLRGWDKVR